MRKPARQPYASRIMPTTGGPSDEPAVSADPCQPNGFATYGLGHTAVELVDGCRDERGAEEARDRDDEEDRRHAGGRRDGQCERREAREQDRRGDRPVPRAVDQAAHCRPGTPHGHDEAEQLGVLERPQRRDERHLRAREHDASRQHRPVHTEYRRAEPFPAGRGGAGSGATSSPPSGRRSDIIVANRRTPAITDVAGKVYARDLFGSDLSGQPRASRI